MNTTDTTTPSAVYRIPAITVRLPRYSTAPVEDREKYRTQEQARKEGLAQLLRTLFPEFKIVTQDHYDPSPQLPESGHYFRVKWVQKRFNDSHPIAIQLRYEWGYSRSTSILRRLTLKLDGDHYVIDKAKADQAAADIIAQRQQVLDYERVSTNAQAAQDAKDRADYAVISKQLTQQGLTVEPADKTGTCGKIWLTPGQTMGAHLYIKGDRVRLCTSTHSSTSHNDVPVHLSLVPEFVALFHRNAVSLTP